MTARPETGRQSTTQEQRDSCCGASPVPHLGLTLEGRVAEAGWALTGLLGYRSEEVVGRSVLDLVHPEDTEALSLELDTLVRADDDAGKGQFRFRHEDGHLVWVEAVMSLAGTGHHPVAVCVALSDISANKRDEEFLKLVLESMDEGMCVVDAEGRVVVVNAAAAYLLGWTEEELRGRRAQEVAGCADLDETGKLQPGCPVSRVLRGEATVRVSGDSFTRRDGTPLQVVYSAISLHPDGAEPGALIVFRPCEHTDSPQPA